MIEIFAAAAARAHGMVARAVLAFLMAALVLIGSAGTTLAADGCTPYDTRRTLGSGANSVEVTIRGDFLEGDLLSIEGRWTGHGGSSYLTATAYTTSDVQIVTNSVRTAGTSNGANTIGLILPGDYTDLKLKISDPVATGFTASLICRHAIPVITTISPSTGPVSGGNTVTITGSYFNNMTAVKFGANAATSFTADSRTQITATVPAGVAGNANVVVTSATTGNSVGKPYTYLGPPTVSTVTPANGTTAGGTTVTITGTALTNATVTLGGTPVALTSNTATSITFATPVHAEGATDLVVTTSGGAVTRSFTFIEPIQAPVITSPADAELVGSKRPTIIGTARAGSAVKVYVDSVLAGTVNADEDGDWTFTVPASLAKGSHTVSVTATDSWDNVSAGTTIQIVVPASNDTKLTALAISGAVLTPSFSSGTLAYSATVPFSTTSATVTPKVSDTGASVSVNGSPVASAMASAAIPLDVGPNTIDVVVVAEDGQTTATYVVTLTRAGPSENADLSSLAVSGATLTPDFSSDVTTYSTSVPNTTTSLTVTPGAVEAGSTITVNGTPLASGATSGAIQLDVGSNTITVVVTAPDGVTTRSYTVDVERGDPASTDARLSGLMVGSLSFSPSFDPGVTDYSGSVANTETSISISPTAFDAGATIRVNGTQVASGATSASIPLNVGANSIAVLVTAEDGQTTQTYTVAVQRASIGFVFSPQVGSLPEAMAGEEYHQPVSASGGTAPLLYSVASGLIPDGLILNISTGELNGPLTADAEGDYSFTIEVRDAIGNVGQASYTLKVIARAVSVADKQVDVPAGTTPPNVYLNAGATGGPFIEGDLISVIPAHAGSAELILGEVAALGPITPRGFYLKFTPDPAFSGQVRIGYRLTSGLGNSNVGIVTYNLNFNGAAVAGDIDALVHGFVETRQNLLSSSIRLPGLMDRRRIANDPVTTRLSPSADGLALNIATSLAQIEAARGAVAGAEPSSATPFNLWVDATLMAHNREENDGRWGTFGLFSAGGDYLINDKVLIGLSAHVDHMTDPTDADANLKGTGWLVGPYGSVEIGKGVFFDTSLLYGGSTNDIDTRFFDGSFSTRRWMWDSSITGRWNLDDLTVLTPRLRAVYLNESVDDYSVANGTGGTLEMTGFTVEQFRVSLGTELERRFVLENGVSLTPRIALAGGLAGLDGGGAFGSVGTGLSVSTAGGWLIDADVLLSIEDDGRMSAGAKLGLGGRF